MTFLALTAPVPADLPWPAIIGLGGLGALLSLDETALVQSWLSQPLPAGLLAGAVCGDMLCGLTIGLPLQLLSLGNLPVGQTFTGDSIGAVVAGVGAVLLAGRSLPPEALLGGAEAAFLGWILVALVLGSLLGHWGVQLERQAHFIWMLAGHRTLRDGNLFWLERLQLRCLAVTAVRGFFSVLCGILLLMWFWLPFYNYLPERVISALALLPWLAPAVTLGVLVDRYGPANCWRWLMAGMTAAFVLTRLVV